MSLNIAQLLSRFGPPPPPPAPKPNAQAELALMKRLQDNPDDLEARVFLLEFYYQDGREKDFLREAAIYRSCLRGNEQTADWRHVRSLGQSLFPESPLFKAGEPASQQKGRFGEGARGKKYFDTLAAGFEQARADPAFLAELDRELIHATGRPTPLRHARRLSQHIGGAQIYFKREDFAQPGSQLEFHVIGQALLARRLGRRTLVTSTAHGQRGVALAATAARLEMDAVIYMDSETIASNPASIFRMWLSGAQVVSVDEGPLRGKDVREAAFIHCLNQPNDTFMVMGLDAGPEPYPAMAREFLAVSGRECRRQVMGVAHRQPDLLVTRAGDNADAIGLFQPFLADPRVRLVCVEGQKQLPPAANLPSTATPDPNANLTERQRRIADSVVEGLLFPSVVREHQWLKHTGRVEYVRMTSDMVVESIQLLSRLEGMIPPIDTAHAIAWACRASRGLPKDAAVVVGLSENTDKDILQIGHALGVPL